MRAFEQDPLITRMLPPDNFDQRATLLHGRTAVPRKEASPAVDRASNQNGDGWALGIVVTYLAIAFAALGVEEAALLGGLM
jgi:hypothetical protein